MISSSPPVRAVKVATGWGLLDGCTSRGLLIKVKHGFLQWDEFKKADIEAALEIQEGSTGISKVLFGGVVGGLITGGTGAVGGAAASLLFSTK